VPATVRRGDLTLAVSTAGKSPAVAAMVRRRLEEQYGPEYEQLLQMMGDVRPFVLAAGNSVVERRILFQKILHDDILHWLETGQWDRVRSHLRKVLGPDCILTSSNWE
jgi:precorrin-2 dehydrogenase/sirohydrochlorin ferrochelatase